MSESSTLEESLEFVDNPEPRCPCVLLLDTSASMTGAPIAALNDGLRILKEDLLKDPVASARVEVAVVSFNSEITVERDFATPDQFDPPILTAGGTTHMGSGIHKALDILQVRKATYKANGIMYYRPWVFMITDGEPQGEPDSIVDTAAARIKDDELNKRVCFFAVGVEGANMAWLAQLLVRPPVKLVGLNFAEMFVWLSRSTGQVSRSTSDEQQNALPPPDWGTTI